MPPALPTHSTLLPAPPHTPPHALSDFYNILKHGSAGDILSAVDVRGSARGIAQHAARPLSPAALALAPPRVHVQTLQGLYARHVGYTLGDPLDALMNGPVRAKLNGGPKGVVVPASVTWGGQSGQVFSALSLDFMKPVTASLDALLASGRINVTIEEGQVDLICANWGAELWLKRLVWVGMPAFFAAPRTPRYPSLADKAAGNTGAFVKRAGVLTKYDVLSAGHMVGAGSGRVVRTRPCCSGGCRLTCAPPPPARCPSTRLRRRCAWCARSRTCPHTQTCAHERPHSVKALHCMHRHIQALISGYCIRERHAKSGWVETESATSWHFLSVPSLLTARENSSVNDPVRPISGVSQPSASSRPRGFAAPPSHGGGGGGGCGRAGARA